MTELDRSIIYYCASPYSRYIKGWHGAYIDACRVASRIQKEHEIAVFCPIAHSHGLSTAAHGVLDPIDHPYWEAIDRLFIDACGALIVAKLDGWQESDGITGEILTFRAANKPILYCDPDTLELAA